MAESYGGAMQALQEVRRYVDGLEAQLEEKNRVIDQLRSELRAGALPGALVTAREAAQLLGLSAKTLANMRSRGGGPMFVRAGGAIRYRKGDLEAWLETRLRRSTSDQGQRRGMMFDDRPGRCASGRDLPDVRI